MKKYIILLILALGLGSINTTYARKIKTSHNKQKTGIASYYHQKFVGRKTSTGEIFRQNKYTAASNFFKLHTYVKVTNISTGKYVYVRINDRMGHPTRVIDCTKRVAKELGYVHDGLTKVKIEVVSREEGKRKILAQRNGTSKQNKRSL